MKEPVVEVSGSAENQNPNTQRTGKEKQQSATSSISSSRSTGSVAQEAVVAASTGDTLSGFREDRQSVGTSSI